MKNRIIAVDFDETLCFKNEIPNIALISRLRYEQSRGNVVILWTCREGESLKTALDFLRQYAFIPNFVNQNSPETIKRLGRDCRKIFADIYIDDKSVNWARA